MAFLLVVAVATLAAGNPPGRLRGFGRNYLPSKRHPNAFAAKSRSTLPTRAVDKGQSVAIVGGGPAGLATALMLARRGYTNIHLFERLSTIVERQMSTRSYNIGLNGRGQIALKSLGALDRISQAAYEVRGRKEWGPAGSNVEEREFTDRRYLTKVILRQNLVNCLREEVDAQAADVVQVSEGVECVGITWEPGTHRPIIDLAPADGSPARTKAFDIVIGVDGAASRIREKMVSTESCVEYTRYPPRNTRVYRTLNLTLPADWRNDVNYAARGDKDRGLLFDALPLSTDMRENNPKILLGAMLSKPGDPRLGGEKGLSTAEARALLNELFPQFSKLASDEAVAEFAQAKDQRLPEFSYCHGQLHYKNSTVLLGDAIHTVKPYFGLGVNAAFEDVSSLEKALDAAGDSFGDALGIFSSSRAESAKALVEISRDFDRDTRNPLELAKFLVPLLLDNLFHNLAPNLFERATLKLLQDERSHSG
ncbi:hypothetical protein AAMO2058_000703800 [Amorphochlora amoebiformis]